mmetsp:Transcript_3851/g.8037  ORF Transcript_3851/g.8037 Transcript_3851/m.8037 type:complete len:80 (+) Transcript_3851:2143-2382(+)
MQLKLHMLRDASFFVARARRASAKERVKQEVTVRYVDTLLPPPDKIMKLDRQVIPRNKINTARHIFAISVTSSKWSFST